MSVAEISLPRDVGSFTLLIGRNGTLGHPWGILGASLGADWVVIEGLWNGRWACHRTIASASLAAAAQPYHGDCDGAAAVGGMMRMRAPWLERT
jgi:hypothetical protein